MITKDTLKQEVQRLEADGTALLALAVNDKEFMKFSQKYQRWYTVALRTVGLLAPDRLDEFRAYYEVDSKRKAFSVATYTIQDYLKGLGANRDAFGKACFDHRNVVHLRLVSQVHIINSITSRIDSVLSDIEGSLVARFQDAEIGAAEELKGVSLRAAGALAGVILESHLQRVASQRGVQIKKAHPTIADLNDPLKQAGVYDTPTWRKMQYLGDVRNLCAHKKDREPTSEEIDALIEGVNWVVKNIA